MSLIPAKLSQYIKDLGLSYKETSQSFIFNCPLCGGKDKLYVRKSDGKFRCFRCVTENGFSGNAEYALIELTDIPLNIVKKTLYGNSQHQASFLDLKLEDFFDEEEDVNEIPEAKGCLPELTWPYHCIPILHPGSRNGLDYLQRRGIPLEIADLYGIRYSPENRAVVFPVYVGTSLLGWQYRTIDKTRAMVDDKVVERPKAWSSPNLPRDKVFMFSNRLINAQAAVLCEGPIDALKCHLFGNGNICAMGKSISAAHVSTLLRSGIKTVYVGLDNDAFAELDPLMSKIGDDINLYRIQVPDVKGEKADLGSLSMEEAYKVIMASEKMRRNRLYIWVDPSFLTPHRV
jgi:hypothetical protein